MANGHGGYREPSNPAPASGPGSKSQRTDGHLKGQPVRDLPDAKYGEGKAFRDAQQAAPMSASLPDLSGIVPFGAPTNRPDEPISSGLPSGAGGGSTLPPGGQGPMTPEQSEKLRSWLPVLVLLASQDDADPDTKRFVRQLRAELG